MAAKWIEVVTGSLEQKKQYKQYRRRHMARDVRNMISWLDKQRIVDYSEGHDSGLGKMMTQIRLPAPIW